MAEVYVAEDLRLGRKVALKFLPAELTTANCLPSGESATCDVSLTSDSGALVSVQSQQLSNIWIAPSRSAGQAKQITSGAGNYNQLTWTPDGKIVCKSNEPGIWIMDEDGTNRRQLTDEDGSSCSVSPDGRFTLLFPTVKGPSIFGE